MNNIAMKKLYSPGIMLHGVVNRLPNRALIIVQ